MTRAYGSRHAVVAVAVSALVALTACGKSNVGLPTSPSASPSGSPSAAGSAVISGSVSRASVSAAGLHVGVSGYGVGSTVGADGRFQINQAPAGNLSLQFTGSGVSSTVPIGAVAERERVEVQIDLSGNAGSVEASEHVTPDDRSEIEGRIESIDPSARSLRVGSRDVLVPSSARITAGATAFDFSALKSQEKVHVSGVLQGATVNADHIEIEDAPGTEPEPEPQAQEAEFTGSVASVSGSCPALSLSVAGKNVSTNASTEFAKAACGDLKAGLTVEVKGTVRADGSVLASRIQVDDNGAAGPPEAETEFTGSIASLGGSCPALSLGVAGRSVSTSSATDFSGISCGELKVGTGIEVKGSVRSDGGVAASRIKPQ